MGSKEFQELAMNAVFQVNPNIAISEMFVVWMVKVLQNNKALISAQSTDNYYEVTYNGDKKELYVDEYIKNTNTCLNVNELKPYENNPRINDGAVKFVKNSIEEFGFKVPIVIDKNGVIVAGHTRYKASQELGLESN